MGDFESIGGVGGINTDVSNAPDIGVNTIKLAMFIFAIFMWITSDVFKDRVLAKQNSNYVSGQEATYSGRLAQGMLLSCAYILLNVLVTNDYI
jgi:hypothetical protein